MSSILSEFMNGAGERLYRELVQFHVKKQSAAQVQKASLGEMERMPLVHSQNVESFIDAINNQICLDIDFWNEATCKQAFVRIATVAKNHFKSSHFNSDLESSYKQENQEFAFQIFQIATLNFAYNAILSKSFRKYIGIKKGIFG